MSVGVLVRVLWVVAMVAGLAGCQSARSLETSLTYMTVPPAQEAALGAQFASEIEAESNLIDDPVATQWLNNMAARLVEHSPPCEQPFVFRLTADETVNAFAIPGGYCYVNLGLLRLAKNEAQVAAVVGHEINHVTTRHGVRKLQRLVGVELLASLASTDPRGAVVASIVKDSGGVLALRSFGRDDEREADRLGVLAMYKAGYDPREAAEFFRLMMQWQEEQGGGGGESALARIAATHPATEERIANILEMSATLDLSQPLVTDTEEFQAVKARLGL